MESPQERIDFLENKLETMEKNHCQEICEVKKNFEFVFLLI